MEIRRFLDLHFNNERASVLQGGVAGLCSAFLVAVFLWLMYLRQQRRNQSAGRLEGPQLDWALRGAASLELGPDGRGRIVIARYGEMICASLHRSKLLNRVARQIHLRSTASRWDG